MVEPKSSQEIHFYADTELVKLPSGKLRIPYCVTWMTLEDTSTTFQALCMSQAGIMLVNHPVARSELNRMRTSFNITLATDSTSRTVADQFGELITQESKRREIESILISQMAGGYEEHCCSACPPMMRTSCAKKTKTKIKLLS